MKKVKIFILILVLIFDMGYTAFNYLSNVGEVYGSGGCSLVSIGNIESLFYNQAGLAMLSNHQLLTSFSKHFYTEGININLYNLGYALPLKNKNIVLGVGLSGLDVGLGVYKEEVYILSLSNRIKNFLAGFSFKILNLSYIQDNYTIMDPIFINGYIKYSYTLDLGFIYYIPTNSLHFGLCIKNLIPADIGLNEKEVLKQLIGLSLRYDFKNSIIASEIKFSSLGLEDISIGYKQIILKNLNLSLGLNTTTFNFSLKYRFNLPNINIEPTYIFSYPYYMETQGSHTISLNFKF